MQMQLALEACREVSNPIFSDITRQFPPVNRQTLKRRSMESKVQELLRIQYIDKT
jgi:hypothetical protein